MAARKRPGTPLDAKLRASIEEQEKLRKRIEDIQRNLQDAPKKRELAERRRKEQISRTARSGGRRVDSPVLLDKRFDVSLGGAIPRRRRPLKSEQRQQQIIFLGLVIALSLLALWVYSVVMR